MEYPKEEIILKIIATVAADVQSVSDIENVADKEQGIVFIDHARDIATASVGAGTEYRIEVSEKSSGNDTWRNLYSVVCGIVAASSIVVDGTEAAGSTQIETGATLPAAGDIVFFENSTIANSEWVKVVAIDATGSSEHFDIQDGLTNAQAGGTYFNKAEQFAISVDLKSAKRLRVVCNNNNGTTNRAIIWQSKMIASK